MPTGSIDLTVSTPSGNRTVTVAYPAVSDGVGTTPLSGPFPTIVTGHGQVGNGAYLNGTDNGNQNGINFAGSTYAHRSLVSLGYMLVGPWFGDLFSGGNTIQTGAAVAKAAINHMRDLSSGNLVGKIDMTRIGYAGTSQGGMVAYALMTTNSYGDSRIIAYYVRATSRTGSSGTFTSGPALCHAHGTADGTVTFSSGQSAYNAHGQPRAFVTLTGKGHDLLETGPYYTNDANPAASGLAGFFGYFLNGDSNGLTVLQTAITASGTDTTMATDWGTLGGGGGTVPPNAGSWAILATISGTTIPTSVDTALAQPPWVGYGLRFPWSTVEVGRVNVTGSNTATSIPCQALTVSIPSGRVLNFDYGTGMSSPGVYVTTSATASVGATSISIQTATAGTITTGARAGIYTDTILENAYAKSLNANKKFKPRFMAGQWTPTHIATDGSFTYVETGGQHVGQTSHGPWIDSNGNPNLVFEKAYRQFVRHLCDWAVAKNAVITDNVTMIDMSNYSMEYSEMYYGPFLQAFGGTSQSPARFATGHTRLIDINFQECWQRYGLRFGHGLSGQGPLSAFVDPTIAQYIETTYGPDHAGIFIQANGWGFVDGSGTPVGDWGTTVANEAVFDSGVWTKAVLRGVQDISPNQNIRQLGDWDIMIDAAISIGCTYTETYIYQMVADVPGSNASTAVHNEMLAAAQRFNDFALAQEIPDPPKAMSLTGAIRI